MKKFIITTILALVALSACGSCRKTVILEPSDTLAGRPMYTSNTLIIMYDEAVGKEPLKKAFADYGAEIIYEYSIINGFAIRIPDDKDIKEAIVYFKKVEGVVSVERDHIYYIDDPVKPRLEVM